jgi:DNA-binding transcriptional ArsR family regulator
MSLTGHDLSHMLRKLVKPIVSPWCEMLTSLHVLDRPEHHSYRAGWARRILHTWPDEQRKELTVLGDMSFNWLTLHGLNTDGGPLGIEEGIKKLGGLPDVEWIWLMLNREFPLSHVWDLMNGSNSSFPPDKPSELWTNTLCIRSRLQIFLQWYHRAVFMQEWRMVEPWLIKETQSFMEAFRTNPAEALSGLHPRLFVKADAIEAQKATVYRFPYEGIRQIVISPSTFIYPHLLIDFTGGVLFLPMHVEPEDSGRDTAVPADFLGHMKAMADANRLQILRLLRAQPYCTQQLALKLQISEAAVSKHLSILLEARLVAPERRGAYVFYRLRPEQAEMTIVYLRQFLEQ